MVSTVLALFPPPALALGVVPFLMRNLAFDLSLAGSPVNLSLGYCVGLALALSLDLALTLVSLAMALALAVVPPVLALFPPPPWLGV